jgi:hypothetical protein
MVQGGVRFPATHDSASAEHLKRRKKMESYTWRSDYGWETVIANMITPEPDYDSIAVRWEVILLHTGEIFPAYSEQQAKTLGHLFAEKYQELALEYTVERDPSEWIRGGHFVRGMFAGLPVEYREGVPGVYLFERWTAVEVPA